MNLFAKQKQTHNLENKSMVTKGEREVEERINQEVGINIYPQLCVKQIINKDPLPSIQNAIQYYVINYMGKESEKKNIYIYIHTHTYIYADMQMTPPLWQTAGEKKKKN